MTTPTPNAPAQDIHTVTIEEEMQRSYLDYAMSVIVSRALPDVRDGLKPVHRRILYAMKEAGFDHTKPYRKSARIVGEVMGKYHPHGDAAIYDSMVRMVQDFSLRLPLIDGHGNFGSMDGDNAAASRYTEARLAKSAHALLEGIDKDTVDFQPNYDNTIQEPKVLPARFPNMLVNGVGGIAVGMATNIPPHNLGEVIDACCAYIENPEITLNELMAHVPGPDFPTGGIIVGRDGINKAYRSGRGGIMMRGKTEIVTLRKDREAIIVTEVPYQVNKAKMVEKIAHLVQQKVIEGISDLRDESDRDGVRVVIELKRDIMADVVLNQLYTHTPLQTSFGANIVALLNGRPQILTVLEIIRAFIEFREEVIIRRTRYELKKAREKAHILVGLAIAVANIDEMIKLIRHAPDPSTAQMQMMARTWPASGVEPLLELAEPGRETSESGTYKLSALQAKAILDLRLHRLTGLEREKIGDELKALVETIKDYLNILGSRERVMRIIREEMLEVKEKFATPRRTEIQEGDFTAEIEDLIQKEDMVVTFSHNGYVKRVPLTTYRAQKRGGKGRSGMSTRDEDFVSRVFVANTHTPLLFFSNRGIAYELKVHRLPQSTPQAKGKAIVNLLPLKRGEKISAVMPLPEDTADWEKLHVMFATSHGSVRRNVLSDFVNIQANGKIAMKLGDNEKLISVQTCNEADDVFLATRNGKSIRFAATAIRLFAGRRSTGVRGVKLSGEDEVISMSILSPVEVTTEERDAYLRQVARLRRSHDDHEEEEEATDADENYIRLTDERFAELSSQEQFILSATSKGFGKRTSAYEYRTAGRGGQGLANMDLTKKNGNIVASFPVCNHDQLMLVTDGGQLIRCPVNDLRIAGRRTQGVTLFRVGKDESVVSVARIEEDGDDDSDNESNPTPDSV
ncbi:MAG: DNA gyrase subunit A [Pseudomonadota bacterium]